MIAARSGLFSKIPINLKEKRKAVCQSRQDELGWTIRTCESETPSLARIIHLKGLMSLGTSRTNIALLFHNTLVWE
jgi:hypothetical protein